MAALTEIAVDFDAKYAALLNRPKAEEVAHTPDSIIALFLAKHRHSPNTYRAYERALRDFKGFFDRFDVGLFDIDEAAMRDVYLESLRDRGLGAQTINQRFAAIKGFYRLAIKHRASTGVFADPTDDVKKPPLSRVSGSRGLTVEQAVLLERAARNLREIPNADPVKALRGNLYAVKATAVVKVLLTTGVRAEELASSNAEGFNTTGDVATLDVIRKGGAGDRVEVPEATREALGDLLDGRTAGPLILSARGRRETVAGLKALLKQTGEDGDLDFKDRLYPHNLRHAFATFCYAAGLPPLEIMTRMGHAKIETTQRYIHLGTRISRSDARRILGL